MHRLSLLLLLAGWPAALTGQRVRPFQITDNSMLVEEAFNQEAGIFQNMVVFQRSGSGGQWTMDFTQEWPLRSQKHQLSYTLPFRLDGFVMRKTALHYRYQLRAEDDTGPALSPRLTLMLPTGPDDGFQWGTQLNIPVSRQMGDLYGHANVGVTWDRRDAGLSGPSGVGTVSMISPHAAGSLIWRTLPMVHVLLESVVRLEEVQATGCCRAEYDTSWLVSPGFRVGRNLGHEQLVFGVGVPMAVVGAGGTSLLLYMSYELPFR